MSGPRDEKSGCDPLGFHGWELINMISRKQQVKGQRRVIFLDTVRALFHLAKSVDVFCAEAARQFGTKNVSLIPWMLRFGKHGGRAKASPDQGVAGQE